MASKEFIRKIKIESWLIKLSNLRKKSKDIQAVI